MNDYHDDWIERNLRRQAIIAGMLDDIRAFAAQISDGRKLTREARPFPTEMELAYRYRGARVTMGVSIAWNPHSGEFEVGLTSRSEFLVVPVEIQYCLGDAYEALLRLIEADADYSEREAPHGRAS